METGALKIAGVFLIIFGIAGIVASGYAAFKVSKLSESKLTISVIESLTEFNLDIIKNRDEIKSKLNSATSGIENAKENIKNSASKVDSAGSKIKTAGNKLGSDELSSAGEDLNSAASELLKSSEELEKSVASLRDVESSLTDFFSTVSENIDAGIQGIEGMEKKANIKAPLYIACIYFLILHSALLLAGIALISAGESYAKSYGEELEELEGEEL